MPSTPDDVAGEPAEKQPEIDVAKYTFNPGTIERGHIYFFYRPKVQHERVHSIGDVRNLHMLLVPRPPKFSVYDNRSVSTTGEARIKDMTVLSEGADVVPAAETVDEPKKRFRLLTIGKKRSPETEGGHDVFWATVTAVGDDLRSLERGLGEKTHETKTRGNVRGEWCRRIRDQIIGLRHEGPVGLAGQGVYAIVNRQGHVPSKDATHLAYHLTHPGTPGAVQDGLGVHTASSFVVQVKNPHADGPAYGQRVGVSTDMHAHYPGRNTRSRF